MCSHFAGALVVLGFVVSATRGQPALTLQDLTLQQVATGLSHAGDLAVDGQGNVWLVEVQGSVGGTEGRMTRVTPQGAVTLGAVTGLPECSDLVRGLDGNIWLWLNSAPGMVTLASVTPQGVVTYGVPFPAPARAAGMTQDATGAFYVGWRQPGNGIGRLAPGGASPVPFAAGHPWTDQLHLAAGAQNEIYVASSYQLSRVVGPLPGQTATIYLPPQPLCPGCGIDLPDFDLGAYGHLLTLSRFYFLGQNATTTLLAIRAQGLAPSIGTLGTAPIALLPALARGLAGDFWFAQSGALYRASGTPAILAAGYQPSITLPQVTVTVDAPPGSPLVVAVDAANTLLSIPFWGTFHTSLGLQSTFIVLADGLGAFVPPDPGAVAPWTQTYLLGPQPLNVPVTVEAYVLHPAAANGLILISNHVDLYL